MIKQFKKETYIDLSNKDLADEAFIKDFKKFTKANAGFLEGMSLSLILPEEINADDEIIKDTLEKLRKELNKKNIAIKKSSEEKDFKEFQKSVASPEIKKEKEKDDSKSDDYFSNVLYLRQNLRAGQQIVNRGDVVVFGDVNHSAEIIASGDIIIWGELRGGVVHAGAEGDPNAHIAALNFENGQIRISDKLLAISSTKLKKRKDKAQIVPEIAKVLDNEVRILNAK